MSTSNRRDLLGQIATVTAATLLAAPAPAIAATTEVDPHLEWEREALALRAEAATPGLEQERFDELFEDYNEIEDLVAETPAMTLAGIAVQLRLTRLGFAEEASEYAQETALETALASLERLAGGRAAA